MTRLLRLLAVVVVLAGAGIVASSRSDAQAPPPTLVTTAAPVSTGQSVAVTGENWPASSLVNLEICGNDARNGSADCAVASAQIVGATPTGTLSGFLQVTAPPSLCPCVVRGTSQASSQIATTPLTISDVGTALPGDAPGIPIVTRQVEVVGATIRDEGGFGGWFGLAPERTLVFALRNTGDVAVKDAEIALAVGKGDDPTGFVEPPELGTIEVGQQATYEVPVDIGPLAFGEYHVVGEITGLTEPVEFTASTTHWPWALILIPVIAVAQFLLLLGRNRMRDRVHATQVALPAPVPAALPTPATVIDVTDAKTPAVVGQGTGAVAAGVGAGMLADRPPVGVDAAQVEGLDATIAEELGLALVGAFHQHGDRPLSDPELVQVAAQLAHVTAVRTARRHDLDMAMTRSLLVSVFAELTERLQVGDDLGDAVTSVAESGNGARAGAVTKA
jgi:hypothetical protein